MIQRAALEKQVQSGLRRSRVVALIGPRQCGKTTLARQFIAADSPNYFDLEDPVPGQRVAAPTAGHPVDEGIAGSPEIRRVVGGYALEETLQVIDPDEAYFWGTHAGAEIDLVIIKRGRKLGVEFKREDAPRLTPSKRQG